MYYGRWDTLPYYRDVLLLCSMFNYCSSTASCVIMIYITVDCSWDYSGDEFFLENSLLGSVASFD